jgi:coenzyme F420-reducing hydrogenase delta subunit
MVKMSMRFEPESVVFYCQQSLAPGEALGEGIRSGPGFRVRLVGLPCSSKIEVYHLVKQLEKGADGIMILACPPVGCRFLTGNTKAERKVQYVRRMLEELNAGPDRVVIHRRAGLSGAQIMDLARELSDTVLALEAKSAKLAAAQNQD